MDDNEQTVKSHKKAGEKKGKSLKEKQGKGNRFLCDFFPPSIYLKIVFY